MGYGTIAPMIFTEFLLANGDENLAKYLEKVDKIELVPDAFFKDCFAVKQSYFRY